MTGFQRISQQAAEDKEWSSSEKNWITVRGSSELFGLTFAHGHQRVASVHAFLEYCLLDFRGENRIGYRWL